MPTKGFFLDYLDHIDHVVRVQIVESPSQRVTSLSPVFDTRKGGYQCKRRSVCLHGHRHDFAVRGLTRGVFQQEYTKKMSRREGSRSVLREASGSHRPTVFPSAPLNTSVVIFFGKLRLSRPFVLSMTCPRSSRAHFSRVSLRVQGGLKGHHVAQYETVCTPKSTWTLNSIC